MRNQGRKLIAFGLLLTASILVSCAKRPPPQMVPNFSERRPLRLAVIPTVYFPVDLKASPGFLIDVKEPAYLQALIDQSNRRDGVLLRAEEEVRSQLRIKGYDLVHRDVTLGVLAEEGARGLMNPEGVCRRLGVDGLVYVSLLYWDVRYIFARDTSPRPKLADYGGGRPQRGFRAHQGGQFPKYHRVTMETLITNRLGEVLWRDRNFPIKFKARGRNREEALGLLLTKASGSALQTLPETPAAIQK